MSVRSRVANAVRGRRRAAAAPSAAPSAAPAALPPLAPLVLAAVRARPPAPPVPVFSAEARRRHASQVLFGVGAAPAVLPAATVPAVRSVDPWWTPSLPARPAEGRPPAQGERLVAERTYAVRTLDGADRELRRRVYLRADGRRRKAYELLADGAVIPDWSSDTLALFAADRLPRNVARVVVTEGAPAAARLLAWDVVAVATLTGAIRTPPAAALAPLVGVADVVLWPDNDEVGVRHMEAVAARLAGLGAARVRLVRWVGGPFHGDAADVADVDAARALVDASEQWLPGRTVLSTVRQAPRPPVRVPHLLELSDAPPDPVASAADAAPPEPAPVDPDPVDPDAADPDTARDLG